MSLLTRNIMETNRESGVSEYNKKLGQSKSSFLCQSVLLPLSFGILDGSIHLSVSHHQSESKWYSKIRKLIQHQA
jgi:hypothetical protein